MFAFQIQGKLYLRIDHIGEGAKWRRTVGQEIYSPLLLAFTEQVTKWKGNKMYPFSFPKLTLYGKKAMRSFPAG